MALLCVPIWYSLNANYVADTDSGYKRVCELRITHLSLTCAYGDQPKIGRMALVATESMTFKDQTPTREDLVESLKGQTLHIPDLEGLFSYWPQYQNPHLAMLEGEINNHLQW